MSVWHAGWRVLGGVVPGALAESRSTLHHAAQLASLPGRWLLPHRPDDSQTALEWSHGTLLGEPIQGVRVGLVASELGLVVVRDGEVAERLDLVGRSRAEAAHWTRERLAVAGIDVHPLRDDVPYELPPFPAGAAFARPAGGGVEELARYLADGDHACRAIVAEQPGASPVRCWPHHFDVGAVLPADPGAPGDGRSVGIGLSPGDEAEPEPYFYVNVWPAPEHPKPPPLPPGARWNTQGWTGAVLPAAALVATHAAAEQERIAVGFLEWAVKAAREILGIRN